MKNVTTKSKILLLTALLVGMGNLSSLYAEEESWQNETVLISPQGDQTVARRFKGDKVLFKHDDPQLAMEWGLANASTTVVLAGEYVVADRIDIPRDDVTLIIGKGVQISLDPETKHTSIPFRGGNGYWGIIPLMYNRGHDNVRVINFGRLVWFCREGEKSGRQTFPIVFDGRCPGGLKGGMVVICGSPDQCSWLIDCQDVQVPLLIQEGGTGAEPFALEGCVNCKLGMMVNLAEKNRDPNHPIDWVRRGKRVPPPWWPPEGMTFEALDMNSSNQGITIERVVAERRFAKPGLRSCEVLDCNASQATCGEIVVAGEVGDNEVLWLCTNGSGPRFTSKGRVTGRFVVKNETILKDATRATVREDVPELPDDLPRFTVKATVEVNLKDGSKKKYTKEVVIDVRDGGGKPEKME